MQLVGRDEKNRCAVQCGQPPPSAPQCSSSVGTRRTPSSLSGFQTSVLPQCSSSVGTRRTNPIARSRSLIGCPQCSSSVGTRRTPAVRSTHGHVNPPAMQLVGRDEKNLPELRNMYATIASPQCSSSVGTRRTVTRKRPRHPQPAPQCSSSVGTRRTATATGSAHERLFPAMQLVGRDEKNPNKRACHSLRVVRPAMQLVGRDEKNRSLIGCNCDGISASRNAARR